MTLIQALLIALFGYLGSIYGTFFFGTVGGWNMIGRPIVAGAIIGLILGDITNGIMIGAAIQALYVGLVTPGMSVPGDVNFASYIGIPLAMVSGASAEYAVAISVPLSLLGVAAIYSVATFNAVFVHRQEKLIAEGNIIQARRIPIYSNISQFIVRFIPIFIACYFGADYVPKLIALIPEQLGTVFQVLGGILPAVGFGLLIKYTLKQNHELIYVLVGFIMIAVLKMPIVAVTILAVFVAYMDYQITAKKAEN
ncbi:mannose/fructose/N-acetylgalactosamine-specific phosphotransferase system component IIC [Breznakia sp. PF5-3]|uniref:PTS mannose/fructose/sorbose/N-acetylgalactosamine transporter subunit IIC n=1 Tax=unclassified Breznakia TaxID=2623764 RepID=UPI0024060CBD|nr:MULTISPECIES: PTS sugar transporter subunit IIC [unclassified Breznakia]MDF9825740.1 mannose/fructose/N-acetylgalactosamine-specific phosphotransferase system component IIC [Breznakia sp. PM6-1]MDF9836086.1 mannose/fructose/N-acetylgalactosamine-specific phosphotransferase system component IIC [Breznakia sp. PF5-3]MDF9838305.1 mannose/fructose/N-acetylgalactosamine-specific phosphotransferase system component IIC [Breznakia sp. PFB2-8]MDF9860299.1 mannose/fructose/N-acetylgalactosamine-speci